GDSTLGEGATPFLRAAKSGDIEIMRLLLAGGADPTHTMPNGATALMYAAGLGWRDGSPLAPSYDQGTEAEAIEAIALLLGLGLEVNDQDEDGITAVLAALSGRASDAIVRLLATDGGADLTIRNRRGETALVAAEASRSGGEALAELLRSLAPAA